MDQRVGVEHFDRSSSADEFVVRFPEHTTDSEYEGGPKMFTARKQAPAHRVAQTLRRAPDGGNQPVQFGVYKSRNFGEEIFEFRHFLKDKGLRLKHKVRAAGLPPYP